MHKVKMKVKQDGKVEVKVIGVNGPTCSSLTKSLEEKLGVVEKDTKTTEFYDNTTTDNTISQGY